VIVLRVRQAAALAPGVSLVATATLAAFGIARVWPVASPLVIATALGALLGNVGVVGRRNEPGTRWAAHRLLKAAVVLLGLQLPLSEIAALGGDGLLVVVVVVGTTFVGVQWLGRRIGVGNDMALLMATGYAVCGASAIAAMNAVTDASDDDVAYALAAVTVCGTASIAVIPMVGDVLELSSGAVGWLAGASVHDVGQVVATASAVGGDALHAAMVVKLSRVALLAPLVALVAARRRSGPTASERSVWFVPPFVVGFLVMALVRSTSVLPSDLVDALTALDRVAFAAALVGLGTGVRVVALRRLGGRPLLLAMAAWAFVASAAFAGAMVIGVE